VLDGGAGNDRVEGQVGNDAVRGGAGNDRLIGRARNDSYNGGTGSTPSPSATPRRCHREPDHRHRNR
jgi:Ca2+-binding RTX toxin-like protein